MTDHKPLIERIEALVDRDNQPDWEDVVKRAEAPAEADPDRPKRSRRSFFSPRLVPALVIALIASGAAAAVVGRMLSHSSPVAGNISALDDDSLPRPPVSVQAAFFAFANKRARDLGNEIYLASYGDSVCVSVLGDGGVCLPNTLEGGIWFEGGIDNFAGIAVDGIARLIVTTKDGSVTNVPVTHNGFRAKIATTGDEISTITAVHTDGRVESLSPSAYSARYDLASHFSALTDDSLPYARADIQASFRDDLGKKTGPARDLGNGIYLAPWKDDSICVIVLDAGGQCHEFQPLENGVWLGGSRTTLAGVAEDGISHFVVTREDGTSFTVPVTNNGFRAKIADYSIGDEIKAITVVHTDGRREAFDIKAYFLP